ncbi:2-(acetamidomethylene)succinate hydrolase [Zhongshania aliphaticivorans]|uniref:2-(Acetamidomethylene)succinate hydrolase n=2 Tax=Zhongshania aliphaticivorans TaxID=1470434 RepID=A0A5S9N133_9GAMM|nr:alpha/beta hydrolase [Zhongshania aliphaticivorans]CAA0082303.1 2-(acetamidomethylene)succinate hydrolase [Zhongshania aliphaticivorans]CAA0084418.1 2-(acetamidomethylene)succinate hydrolase [Zhongshania aliphaticivorans]
MFTSHQYDFGFGPASWLECKNSAPPLHFSAANGFPVASYQFFLKHFQRDFSLLGLENRGAWDQQPPPADFSWQQHADDLIAFLEYRHNTLQQGPVIAMGHSIGGTVSALAAVKRPDLFKALVMFDPATLPGRVVPLLAPVTPKALMGQIKLVKSTLRRQTHWQSRAAFIDYHRSKPAYRRFSQAAFEDYALAGLKEQENGQLSLTYNRTWEAHNFQHTHCPWQALSKMTIPTLVLRGERSFLHKKKDFERNIAKASPLVSHVVIRDAGHMILQEDCEQVVAKSYHWLRRHNLISHSS